MNQLSRVSTIDLPSLLSHMHRVSVGFDDMFNNLHRVTAVPDAIKYPPHDIIKHSDVIYTVEVAVSGFKDDEITVTVEDGVLSIKGNQTERTGDYIHRGISTRSFHKSFPLAEHVRVNGASLNNGLLVVELEVVIPEALKPRSIEIKTPAKQIAVS